MPTPLGNEPRRPRKLLLHAREIEEIRKAIDHDKKTLIPLRIYLKNGLIKTEIALATGKKKGDKRDAIRTREEKREAEKKETKPEAKAEAAPKKAAAKKPAAKKPAAKKSGKEKA